MSFLIEPHREKVYLQTMHTHEETASLIIPNAPIDYSHQTVRMHRLIRFSLRKHAYSTILNTSPPKSESFQIKILIFFHISAQNIDCGYSLEPPGRGGSNEYHNLCFEQK